MRINLRTFEIFVTAMLIFSLLGVLSILPGVQLLGFAGALISVFFLHEIEKEWQRRKKKAVFYKRMEKIIARRLQDVA
ncbi:MAG: hypothetical protein HXK77_04970 [Lachnospiraceae bacterium]|jgi:hypothetical protein|nr:hypothetical protein [Lachnospiraceae bacterium]